MTRMFLQYYRHIDVSSFKEVIKRWYPEADEFKKASSHRAMDDIKESVNELKFYREKLFIKFGKNFVTTFCDKILI